MLILTIQQPEEEKNAIRNVLLLVAATTLNTRSTLIQGEERLGQVPYPETSPNPGKYPISSVAAEQIDLTLLEMQEKYAAAILPTFRNAFEWECMNTVISILLVHVAQVIEHDIKYAVKQGVRNIKFSICAVTNNEPSSLGVTLQDHH